LESSSPLTGAVKPPSPHLKMSKPLLLKSPLFKKLCQLKIQQGVLSPLKMNLMLLILSKNHPHVSS